MEDTDSQSPPVEHDTAQASRIRTIDPSEAVTGVAIVLGILGGAIGVVFTFVLADASSVGSWIAYCLIAALAGGSAGIVVGGMFGAIFAVTRGTTVPAHSDRQG
ncbi:hypothetical protein ACOJBM_24315 [Rhizobium beringeri]|jgi:hypothetical protein|uniref:Uncharacterized protein n=1 Tax=Rhizobium leguminosarum TaxID=384 RepID=A0A444HPK7_RHILE|nr:MULTISPECIES: hypothetical protein [Rhizobium]MBY5458041.1 NAD(P)(+) transhydrogenase (Re/Si-specific) subunit beta [Rhizobium leguminosarum]NKL62094.1 hypothetical protein [Rhizobium leguminosarum bv. viciae]RWX17363.1 hypothetical protein EHI45_06010 [Rhizobium leguminosarum]RWX24482.1 hypothetical protein EHI47_28735 [Rhizobium leguminosarum]TAU51471.1 hypothetical protein ELI43_00825 [Rhizobium leguminosarum]